MRVSYSLMRNLFDREHCPRALKYEFLDGFPGRDSKTFLKGRLFEYILTGATRDGQPVEFPRSRAKGREGEKLKEELDIEEAAAGALKVLNTMGIDMSAMKMQVELFDESDLCVGHIDMVGTDIENLEGHAIYDVKYTETEADDKWRGWDDFEAKVNEKLQATHYIYLAHETYGEWMPYYFIIFGKSGWVRIIKCVVELATIEKHMITIRTAMNLIDQYYEEEFPARPDFNRCLTCPFNNVCEHVAKIPSIEKYLI
jgi:CRISPR/Cas system-associated exonuclease Cas4 (RecB family)